MARPPQRDAASRRGQTLVAETGRLLIRLPENGDASACYAIHADPDVMRWLGGSRTSSVEDELERIAAARSMHDELGFAMWTVEEKNSGEIVGLAGLFPVELEGPDIEVAYHFRKDRWRRGYATEAAQACIDYGLAVAGLTTIVGLVDPPNKASQRVLEKCGMKFLGTAHHYDKDLLKYSLDSSSRP